MKGVPYAGTKRSFQSTLLDNDEEKVESGFGAKKQCLDKSIQRRTNANTLRVCDKKNASKLQEPETFPAKKSQAQKKKTATVYNMVANKKL